jgi:molybdopterin/thiamine biosynthesis adenylyltransferase
MRKHIPEFITRHSDLIPEAAYGKKIIIVGAGAIGSFVTLSLAKMGYKNLHVYDFDTVEPENIGAQFFDTASIGKKKVDALAEMVWNFTGIEITKHDRKVTISDELNADIVVAAVDSMEVRNMIFGQSNCYWLIDPRMGAEYACLYTVEIANGTKEEHENYSRTLYTDKDAVQERCTAKTTIYTVLLIAGEVIKAVKDLTTGNEAKRVVSMDYSIRDNAKLTFGVNGRL